MFSFHKDPLRYKANQLCDTKTNTEVNLLLTPASEYRAQEHREPR